MSILAGRDRIPLDNGMELRLLSALEALQARREGRELAQDGRELALCSNACLLARALERAGGRAPLCGVFLKTGGPRGGAPPASEAGVSYLK